MEKINVIDEMLQLSAQLMLSSDKSENLRISSRLNELAAISLQEEGDQEKTTTGILHFTQKEIAEMPKTFKKEFIINGCTTHIIKRPSGKNTFCYEIRYRRNGYNITASSKDIDIAKQKFIEKLKTAIKHQNQIHSIKSFASLSNEWLSVRKSKIHPTTYRIYESVLRRFILPYIGDADIDKIKTIDINRIIENKSGKIYEDIRSVCNQVFKYANVNGIISHNPVSLVEFRRAERTHGQPLSIEEERLFIEKLQKPEYTKYRQGFYAMLCFGLRPGEVNSIKIDGQFITCKNAKRKRGKIEYKKIPISPLAEKIIDFSKPIELPCASNKLCVAFKRIFPEMPTHKPYDLRHTFSTRCQMYVRQEIVEIWLGDSSTRIIGNTYTHFPDNFMIEEMKKVNYLNDLFPNSFPN